MVFLEITKSNYNKDIEFIKKKLSNNKSKLFILFFMEGCGPCNATRPEWNKLKNIDSINNNDFIIASIDKDLLHLLNNNKIRLVSFPTIIYVTKKGDIIENYEDSPLDIKDRSLDSFVNWINYITKKSKMSKTKKNIKHTKNTNIGGKWSRKYKMSINCLNPHGFSQKQYCKYGRKRKNI